MFRTVFLSIIRGSRLYIQHQVYVIQVRWLLTSGPEMEHLGPASKQSTNLYDIHLMLYVQSWTPDDGRKDRPKHVEWYSINSKQKIVNLICFTVEINQGVIPFVVVSIIRRHTSNYRSLLVRNSKFVCLSIIPGMLHYSVYTFRADFGFRHLLWKFQTFIFIDVLNP